LDFRVTTGSWPREQQPTGRHWLAALKRNAVGILGISWAKHLMPAFGRLVAIGRVPVQRTI
jgi:hypothetical protein